MVSRVFSLGVWQPLVHIPRLCCLELPVFLGWYYLDDDETVASMAGKGGLGLHVAGSNLMVLLLLVS